MEERISKKQLMELYGVNRNTIEDWRRTKGLKMIDNPLTRNTSLKTI